MARGAVEVAIDGAVGRITLNRPEALNAITVELATQLEAALREVDARVVVLRGAGGNFCAGGDFRELDERRANGTMAELFEAFGRACAAIAELEAPVIAVVEGVAMAGGFELMQACDMAIVADDARIADNHLNFGMVPGGGSTQRLPRLVGRQRALGHILTGERLTGTQAAAWGLAYRAAPAQQLDAAAGELVDRLAGRDPAALAVAKRMVYDGLERPFADGLAMERERVVAHIASDAGGAAMERFR